LATKLKDNESKLGEARDFTSRADAHRSTARAARRAHGG
jgi:hypothetical protein